MTHQHHHSTQMSSDLRFDGGSSATWRSATTMGVDFLFGGIYGLREQRTEIKGGHKFADRQPNLDVNPNNRSGRYRLKIAVPA